MSPSATTARDALRHVIVERNAAVKRLEQAKLAEQRGREMLAASEAKVAAFGDVTGDIVRLRAQRLKRAATTGGPNADMSLPDDLLARRREHDEAKEHLAAARAAHDELVAAREAADRALQQCEQQVAAAAQRVVVEEATQQAAALEAAWTSTWQKVDALGALAGLPDSFGPNRLPPIATSLLQTIQSLDWRQFPGSVNPATAGLRDVWRRWYAALQKDADAKFTDQAAPPAKEQKVA